MVIDGVFIKLGIFLQSHNELTEMLLRLQNIEEVLSKDDMRHMFLSTLICTDTIEQANESLEKLTFIQDNLKYINLDEKIQKEVKKYLKDSLKNVRKELKNLKNNS